MVAHKHIPSESLVSVKADVKKFSFYYGDHQALFDVNLEFHSKVITALVGPSGCGKTTLLRCFNRMHDLYPGNRYDGEILLYPSGTNIVDPRVDPIEMRIRHGMVFQRPNPFPKSIFENVAFGLRIKGIKSREEIAGRVEQSLKSAALWEETKNRLHKSAMDLSGGQQQRLCIARALATEPEILLFDEPTSALDPVATTRVEELLNSLRHKVTIIIVTHNMQQAARLSDYTAFMYMGKLIEVGPTEEMFQRPKNKLTEEYMIGRFG